MGKSPTSWSCWQNVVSIHQIIIFGCVEIAYFLSQHLVLFNLDTASRVVSRELESRKSDSFHAEAVTRWAEKELCLLRLH